MVCVERGAVRGKYGIEGDVGKDCALAFFCDRCTLVNIDREIRAREGDLNLRNSDGYLKYLRQQGLQTEQPGLNQPMAYLSPNPTPNQPSGTTTQHVSSNSCPEMSQAGARNHITRPSMAAVKNPGKPQKAQRRSKLSSAYLTPSDDDGEELLPQEKGKQRVSAVCRERDQGVSHTLENCETAFVDIPLTQHDLGNCKKSTILAQSTSQHKLEDCNAFDYAIGVVQHELEKCQVGPSSPVRRAQHPLTQCENVEIDDPVSQHGFEQCQTTASKAPKTQHLLEQCQIADSKSSSAPQKQHQLGECAGTLPEMVFSQTSLDHTLAVCEDSNGKSTITEESSHKSDPTPQHVLADCPVQISSSKQHKTISGPINKDKNTHPNRHRLSSCPVSSPDSSSEDPKSIHHVAENAEISTHNNLENGGYTKGGAGALRQDEMRQTRNDGKKLVTSQTVPRITMAPDKKNRRQNQETQPKVTSKGKQRSGTVNEAKVAIDEYRTAEYSAQLSLAKFLESKGATVGHASSQHQAGILEAAASGGRRTRSDDGVHEDSDSDSESLAGSGEEVSNRDRSTWFARVTSPFKGRE